MHMRVLLALAAIMLFSTVAFAQPVAGQPTGSFQVNYFSNLLNVSSTNSIDSIINITNDGSSSTSATNGSICVNVYTFANDEQEVSCCTCNVTPNGLASLAVKSMLTNNTLTPGVVNSGVVKLLASSGGSCNAATPTASTLTTGLHAWGTHVHGNGPGGAAGTAGAAGTGGAYSVTENAFQDGILSQAELARITSYCGFIQVEGSGYGICSSCNSTGLGGTKK